MTWTMTGLCCCRNSPRQQRAHYFKCAQKRQCLTPLKDYHFIEIKVGLKAYLRHGVSCMDDRIYPEHRRHTRVIANVIPDSESVHDE